MPPVNFSHPNIGTLTIDNGIDDAQWGYNLNTAVFPTYGGEVVQILSVYIDDLHLDGTVATYKQAQSIYSYFATYMQIATQGKNQNPNIGDSISGSAYNLYPVVFQYPHRKWSFKIYPKQVPGFRIHREVVTPVWHLIAHVIDDSPDIDLIKNGIKSQSIANTQGPVGSTIPGEGKFSALKGEISPGRGDPEQDPWQTYDGSQTKATALISKYGSYYNGLAQAYQSGDFGTLTGKFSKPNTAKDTAAQRFAKGLANIAAQATAVTATATGASSGASAPTNPSSSGHNAEYNGAYNQVWTLLSNGWNADVRAGKGGTTHLDAAYNSITALDQQGDSTQRTAYGDAVTNFTTWAGKQAPPGGVF